ncbi:hypothetical protein [Paeniglutamicibacter cryotolerans]|uniref:Uncharacterized protein n=1 Tax=Paeniglutamicibacter cryotolerans TaxID=670079 RepID=A0A839QJ57_9MICC|nr:hypothetical protein [Paeniglutamicibacter cryotolerans]MBB2994575.1 hypothetical protein [Paeniglutamicibacter cryotolerans]
MKTIDKGTTGKVAVRPRSSPAHKPAEPDMNSTMFAIYKVGGSDPDFILPVPRARTAGRLNKLISRLRPGSKPVI